MKKILILMGYKTVNYGSGLQSYATFEILKQLGYEVNVLNLDVLWKEFRLRKVKFYLCSGELEFILRSKGGMYLGKITKIFQPRYRKKIKKRKEKFSLFLQDKLKFTAGVKDFEEASELSKRYDYVLLGSDQVWLPSSVMTDVYTLSFVDKNVKKIAYAPSFGIGSIPKKYWSKYRNMFIDIDYIALREDSGRRIVEEIAGKKCEVVADPVLLLKRNEWERAISSHNEINEKYLFCYLIGNNKWHREWIKKYADIKKLKTVAIIHLDQKITRDEKVFDYTIIDASLEQFLNFIRHAEIVFTDSFHCTIFSIIEHKKFWCFKRFEDDVKISTNSRLDSLLKRTGLEDHVVSKNCDIESAMQNEDIEYHDVDKKIDDFRENSLDFLKMSLE